MPGVNCKSAGLIQGNSLRGLSQSPEEMLLEQRLPVYLKDRPAGDRDLRVSKIFLTIYGMRSGGEIYGEKWPKTPLKLSLRLVTW